MLKECEHEWVEGVDEDGNLIEPAFDVCIHCGATDPPTEEDDDDA